MKATNLIARSVIMRAMQFLVWGGGPESSACDTYDDFFCCCACVLCVCVLCGVRGRGRETPLCSSGLHWAGPVDARHSNDSITTREPFFSLLPPSHSPAAGQERTGQRTGLGSEEIFSSCHPNTKDLLPPSFSTSLFSLPTPTPTLTVHTKRETTTLTHTHTSFSLTPLSHTSYTMPKEPKATKASKPIKPKKSKQILLLCCYYSPRLSNADPRQTTTPINTPILILPLSSPSSSSLPPSLPTTKTFFSFVFSGCWSLLLLLLLSCFFHTNVVLPRAPVQEISDIVTNSSPGFGSPPPNLKKRHT